MAIIPLGIEVAELAESRTTVIYGGSVFPAALVVWPGAVWVWPLAATFDPEPKGDTSPVVGAALKACHVMVNVFVSEPPVVTVAPLPWI